MMSSNPPVNRFYNATKSPGGQYLAPQWNRCNNEGCELKDTCKRYVAYMLDAAVGYEAPPTLMITNCQQGDTYYIPVSKE